ncbi:hypothetical protein LINGRAHAP2_LOCUS10884 [Linum grandiflorum]
MRWYLDEDGFPKRGLTMKSEMDYLLKKVEITNDSPPMKAEDLDDVLDETLLPLPIPSTGEIKQSQLNDETENIKVNYIYYANEELQGKIKLLDTPIVRQCLLIRLTGPPTIPLQLFDMTPRPQGIVIREPTDEEDFLENSSPDTVLFKTPETVMQELSRNQVSSDELMAEQCAIEADLMVQN